MNTAHLGTYFSGWIGRFTGGYDLGFGPWPYEIKRNNDISFFFFFFSGGGGGGTLKAKPKGTKTRFWGPLERTQPIPSLVVGFLLVSRRFPIRGLKLILRDYHLGVLFQATPHMLGIQFGVPTVKETPIVDSTEKVPFIKGSLPFTKDTRCIPETSQSRSLAHHA